MHRGPESELSLLVPACCYRGSLKGDIVISFDGKTHAMRDTDLIVYALAARQTRGRVPVIVMRPGKRIDLTLPMQE